MQKTIALDLTEQEQLILAAAVFTLWGKLTDAGTRIPERANVVSGLLDKIHAAGCASWVGPAENRPTEEAN
jgi:hypothetical protein